MIIKRLQELMDFKNLIKRLFFSFLIIIIYLFSLVDLMYLLFLGFIVYLFIFYEVYSNFIKHKFLIFLYLFISFLCYYFYIQNYFILFYFNLLIFSIVSFDTFSYFFGVLFGRNYIFKNISPKKTLEGYLGGILFTNVILIFYLTINTDILDYKNLFILINTFIILALFGDLFESFLKRKNKLKDSSNFIPGHGGFFDRFDSFIPNIIFLFLYSYII